jgi:hypothetical protein
MLFLQAFSYGVNVRLAENAERFPKRVRLRSYPSLHFRQIGQRVAALEIFVVIGSLSANLKTISITASFLNRRFIDGRSSMWDRKSTSLLLEVRDEESSMRADSGKEGKDCRDLRIALRPQDSRAWCLAGRVGRSAATEAPPRTECLSRQKERTLNHCVANIDRRA